MCAFINSDNRHTCVYGYEKCFRFVPSLQRTQMSLCLRTSQRVLDGIGPTNRHLVAFHTFTVQVSNTDTLRRIHHISRHHSFDTVIHGKKTGGNCLHCCFLFRFFCKWVKTGWSYICNTLFTSVYF